MRIAAFSDIHGNAAALRAIWECLRSAELAGSGQIVLNAGDTVAYGPDTMQCVDFVREPARRIVSVGGNYDYNVARFPEKIDSFRKKWGKLRPDKFRALEQASLELTGGAEAWLADLPKLIELEIGGALFSVSHYAPGSDKEGLLRATPDPRLEQIAAELAGRIDVVVVGHTHSPFVRRAGGVLFVNPGSVGRSFWGPTYAEITVSTDEPPSGRIMSCRATQR